VRDTKGGAVKMKYEIGRCRLKEILKRKGMTQSELALKVGVDKRQISHFAVNRFRMALDNAISIAATLHCDVTDLYEIIEIKLDNTRTVWNEFRRI
jgi:DNA-binding XRE family transcriptional regulator